MADKKFSELETASEIKNSDFMALSQDTGNGLVSLKATILAIATKILTAINFTSALSTTDKTVLGAINEIAEGGGGGGASTEIIADDFDVTSTYAVGDYVVYDGKLYKCTTAVSTAGQWDANDWTETIVMDEVEQGGGGTGGHTIIDENGNSMTARAGLQFVGANVSDDGTNNKTIVDISGGGGGFGLVQSGHTVYTLTGQNLEDRVSITFDTPFPEVPNVALSLSDPSRGQYYNPQTGLGVMNVTENGFDILIKSSSQAVAGDILIYWIATTKFSGNGIFHPVIYSTEERVIGVWTDGKPLYQKTFTIQLSNVQDWTLVDDSVSYDTLVSTIGTFYESGAPGDQVGNASNRDASPRVCVRTDHKLYYYATSLASGKTFNYDVTIQYTKLTDTAGSGSWTPQGVPTHHYSTDEQVIGTYLGETLYEKTIVVSALSIGENTINHLISGIGEIIKVEGKANYSGDCINMPYTSTVTGYVVGIQANATRILINVGASFNTNDFSNISITLQYTKSS